MWCVKFKFHQSHDKFLKCGHILGLVCNKRRTMLENIMQDIEGRQSSVKFNFFFVLSHRSNVFRSMFGELNKYSNSSVCVPASAVVFFSLLSFPSKLRFETCSPGLSSFCLFAAHSSSSSRSLLSEAGFFTSSRSLALSLRFAAASLWCAPSVAFLCPKSNVGTQSIL